MGIVIWLALLFSIGFGFLCETEAIIGWGYLLSAFMALITFVGLGGAVRVLLYPRLYRLLLGLLLVSAFTTAAAAGSTLAFGGVDLFSGFIVVGTINLVLAIATWRAMVSPSAARAAGIGLVAIVIELFAFLGDAMINYRVHGHETAMIFTIFAALATMAAGAITSFAALVCFGGRRVDDPLPQAQLVTE